MAGGRPSKYDPNFCDMLITHMAGGMSFESFAGVISVSESTINLWQQEHKEFSDAHQVGISKMRQFWEEMGVVGSTEGKNFNAAAWKYNVANKLKWSEKQEITGKDGGPINIYLNTGTGFTPAPETGATSGLAQIQSISLAPQGTEDINGTQ